MTSLNAVGPLLSSQRSFDLGELQSEDYYSHRPLGIIYYYVKLTLTFIKTFMIHNTSTQEYIFWPFPRIFVQIEKTGKNLKEDLKKGKEKGGKRRKQKRVIKHTLKYLYEA